MGRGLKYTISMLTKAYRQCNGDYYDVADRLGIQRKLIWNYFRRRGLRKSHPHVSKCKTIHSYSFTICLDATCRYRDKDRFEVIKNQIERVLKKESNVKRVLVQ